MTKKELFKLISNANISDSNRYNLFHSLAAFEKMFKDSDVLYWVNDDGDESDQLIDRETQLAVFLHHGLQGEDEILMTWYPTTELKTGLRCWCWNNDQHRQYSGYLKEALDKLQYYPGISRAKEDYSQHDRAIIRAYMLTKDEKLSRFASLLKTTMWEDAWTKVYRNEP